MLQQSAAGFGNLALLDLLARSAQADSATPSSNSQSALTTSTQHALAARQPHLPARAKRVIFLFMYGGPSHVDSFDYKPLLTRDHGKPLPFAKPRVQFQGTNNLFQSPWKFRQHGQSGAWVSELFPHVAECVDDLTFVKSLHGSNAAHGGALLMIHTGSDTFVRPSLGSWISYGLGTENQNLPSFMTISPTLNHGGVQNFAAAFLPAVHQGTRLNGGPAASINYLTNKHVSHNLQQARLQALRRINRQQQSGFGPNRELDARIESFELAFRMQTEAPQVIDISGESRCTQAMYGLDNKRTETFGRQCLLARRLAEAGVRFVQCSHRDGERITWDDHSNLKKNHAKLAHEVDKPIAGLLKDLKQRGLLNDTLVIWGGEFGRTPTAEGQDGRDHNPHGFTWWMAGAGLKPGFSYGQTDDYGYYAVQDKVHIHDMHATILYLLGLDHERLVYRYAGRDFRLTDVYGNVVHDIIG